MKDVLKFATIEDGEQYVMIHGIIQMLKWYAISWDIQQPVRNFVHRCKPLKENMCFNIMYVNIP